MKLPLTTWARTACLGLLAAWVTGCATMEGNYYEPTYPVYQRQPGYIYTQPTAPVYPAYPVYQGQDNREAWRRQREQEEWRARQEARDRDRAEHDRRERERYDRERFDRDRQDRARQDRERYDHDRARQDQARREQAERDRRRNDGGGIRLNPRIDASPHMQGEGSR